MLCSLLNTQAQTATVYDDLGRYVGAYSKIKDAIKLCVKNYYKIKLSANHFKEDSLIFNIGIYTIVEGTISGKDSTVLDANGGQFLIYELFGELSNVILTGVRPGNLLKNYSLAPLYGFNGVINGSVIIRNNISGYTAIVGGFTLLGDLQILNNIFYRDTSMLSPFHKYYYQYGGLCASLICLEVCVLAGDISIINNSADHVGGIAFVQTGSSNDTALLRSTAYSGLYDKLVIKNNKAQNVGAIAIYGKGYLEIFNADISNNIATDTNGVNGILIDSANHSRIYRGERMVNVFHIYNSRIYNPNTDGSQRIELKYRNNDNPLTDKSLKSYFKSFNCWWGSSDTTGIFSIADTTLRFNLLNWSTTKWYGVPYTKGSTLTTLMRLNNGASISPKGLYPALKAEYYADSGLLSKGICAIDSNHYFSTHYTYPSSGKFNLMGVIDADTFRANTPMSLGVPELGFEQVSIYPNPAKEQIIINNIAIGTQIQLYDMAGRLVLNECSIVNPAQVNIQSLPAAPYLLKLMSTSGAVGTVKIIKKD